MERGTNRKLLDDIKEIRAEAEREGYVFNDKDVFALGYLAGKYGLTALVDNKDAVHEACKKYDETDDLALLDTIGETLMDLGYIRRDGTL